jgi:hypothetical protein
MVSLEFFIDILSATLCPCESIQPLTEMSTRNIFWGKGGQCLELTTSTLSCADFEEIGGLNLLEPSGFA